MKFCFFCKGAGNGVTIHGSSWIKAKASVYIKELWQKASGKTNIEEKISLALMSRAIDNAIEYELHRGVYNEKNILVIKNPFGLAPLTALALFETTKKCRVRVTVEGDCPMEFESKEAYFHRIPILGMYAGRENYVRLELVENGICLEAIRFSIQTPKLSRYLKNMIGVGDKKKESALPFVFIYGGDTKYPYVFDEKGEIRYYLKKKPKAYGLFPMSKGRFLFLQKDVCQPSYSNPHSMLAYEMDFFGRVYREYFIDKGLHHDAAEMEPGGNIISLSSSFEESVEDAVVEIDRLSGKIVKQLNIADVLKYHPYLDSHDWAHINTVSYLLEERCIIVCLRNLHSVLKISWETNEVIWILCEPLFWKGTIYEEKVLKGNCAWSFQPHASYIIENQLNKKHCIIFDNHWHARRPAPSFDGDKKSYVRIYEIDEMNRSITLKKSYSCPKSKIRSNAQISKDGRRVFAMCGYLNKPINDFEGVVLEFDTETGEQINCYRTYNSFYRGYSFFADFEQLAAPMEESVRYIAGELTGPVEEINPKWGHVHVVHLLKHWEKNGYTRKRVRKEIRLKQYNADAQICNYRKELQKVNVFRVGDNVMIRARDHLIKKVHFIGKKNCFVQNYDQTVQKTPALFSDFYYYIAIPIDQLLKDRYEIYLECEGGIYNIKKYFTV